MKNDANVISSPRNRRSFLKAGLAAAGAVGTGLLARGTRRMHSSLASPQAILPSCSSWLLEKPSKLTFTPNTTNWEESRTEVVRQGSSLSAEDLMSNVYDAAANFCSDDFNDDVTILVVKCDFGTSPTVSP